MVTALLGATFLVSWIFLYWYCKWHNPADSVPPRDALIWMTAFVIDTDSPAPLNTTFKTTGIRTFFAIFLFASFTLTMAYRGILTSVMTVSVPNAPIDTIRTVHDLHAIIFVSGNSNLGTLIDDFEAWFCATAYKKVKEGYNTDTFFQRHKKTHRSIKIVPPGRYQAS